MDMIRDQCKNISHISTFLLTICIAFMLCDIWLASYKYKALIPRPRIHRFFCLFACMYVYIKGKVKDAVGFHITVSLGFISQPVLSIWWFPDKWESLSQKRVNGIWEIAAKFGLWPAHAHTHICTPLNTHVHTTHKYKHTRAHRG